MSILNRFFRPRGLSVPGSAFLCFMTSLTLAAGGAHAEGWHQAARMEEGRVLSEAASDGTDIYVAGGSGISGPRTSFDLYDTVSDMWRPLPPMPTARERFGMAAFSGRIYVSGGRSKDMSDTRPAISDELWVFDTVSRVWSQKADMPSTRVDHVLIHMGDQIYAIGGTGPDASRIYLYDVVKDRWSVSNTVMPEARKGFGVAVDGKSVYIIGGVTMDGLISSRVDVLNTETGKWSRSVSIPKARTGLAATSIRGRLHIAGGSVPDPAMTFNDHYSWAPGENDWRTEEHLPTARHSMASALVNDRWYIIGGGAAAGFYTLFAASDAVEVLEPAPKAEREMTPLSEIAPPPPEEEDLNAPLPDPETILSDEGKTPEPKGNDD